MTDEALPSADPGALRRSSVRGAAATFAGQILRVVLQFGAQVLLARMLLPAQFGLVAMIGPVLTFVALLTDLGLTQVTVQRPSISQAELSALFWVNAGIGLACAAAVALMAPLIAAFYGEPSLAPIVACLAALLLVPGLSAQHVALMNRRMQFGRLAAMDVSCTALAAAAGLLAARAGCGAWSLVIMQAANALTILAVSWAMSGWLPSWPRWEPGGAPGVLRLLRVGGHLTGFNLISFLGANLDSVLLGRFAGPVPLGLYDRAFKLVAAPVWTLSFPIDRVAVALLSRLHGDEQRYRRAYLEMVQALLFATLPALAVAVSTAHIVVPLLLGPAWQAASPVVAWLAAATAFAPLSISAYWLFVSQGRTGEQVRYAAAGTVLSVAASLAGLPWGAVGVAMAHGASAFLVLGLPLWGATRQGPVGRGDVARCCLPLLLAGVVAAAAVHLAEPRLAQAGVGAVQRLACDGLLSYTAFAAARLCLPGGRGLLLGLWDLRLTLRPPALPAAAAPQ